MVLVLVGGAYGHGAGRGIGAAWCWWWGRGIYGHGVETLGIVVGIYEKWGKVG
jgi:hypothetical protein